MRLFSVLALLLTIPVSIIYAQTNVSQPKWQSGTITSVTTHDTKGDDTSGVQQYEVSVKVGNDVYVVLYTPPQGSNTVRYRAGTSLQVLVANDTVTFTDLLGRANTLPILRREPPKETRSQ